MGGLFSNVRFTSEPEGVEGKGGAPAAADPAPGEVTIAAGAPIEIASLQAISGAVASLGTDQVTAIEIAIEDRGQIKGYDINLTSEDDLCSAEGGQAGAEKIRANPQMVGVVGTSCSGAQRAAMPILAAAGIVMISGSNTSPGLTATGYLEEGDLVQGENWMPGFFRTAHNDEFQGQGAAQFVYENLGLTRAATIHDGDPYTEGLVTQFAKFFELLGGEVVLATSVNKGDTDMRPVLTEVQAAEPDALYFPIFQPEGDFVVKQAQEVFGE
jgi:branched-chain amino acid transport system substrate-binding protein